MKQGFITPLKSLRDADPINLNLVFHDIRPRAFRSAVKVNEYNDMLQQFLTGQVSNKVDAVTNEFL